MESSLKKNLVREHIALLANDSDIAALQRENEAEISLSFRDAMVLYKPAVFWSLFFSLGAVMCAFDDQLLSSLYATPAFRRDFGYRYGNGYVLPAQWMSALSMGGPTGQTFGALFAAYPMERFGRKKTFGACVVLTAGFVFIQFFARSLEVLFMGELLGGLVLGTYVVIAPSYASEVCPLALRGVLTSCINISFVAGQLIASVVTTWTSRLDSHWAYSAPFATQWIWPVIILVGLPFAPESPWWLQRQGRLEEAEASLKQLASSDKVDVKSALAMIIETDQLERKLEANSTWWDCLSGTNLRRTEIAVGVYCVQIVSGVYLVGYATYFFELAGLTTSQAFTMNIGFLILGFLGTCLSWILLLHYGRRSIYVTGIAVLAVLQFMIAILDCAPDYEHHHALAWGQVVLMQFWNFIYGMSIGPLCFVILCEVSATRLRSKTIAIATAMQATLSMLMATSFPYIFNQDQLNARGKVGFVFGTSALLCLIWAWLRVPELSGRTYQQLDVMFERQVKTKEFKNYVIEGED